MALYNLIKPRSMKYFLKKSATLLALTALVMAFALPVRSQTFAKKETDPNSQYKVKNRSGGDYVYKSGGKRYNAKDKKYEYETGRWVKRKDNYRGSKDSFCKARYNIKQPRSQRGERRGLFGKKRGSNAAEPSDTGTEVAQ